MSPRFSILLPTHNRVDVLLLSIASVLAQTETDFELLVVADGCTDGTQAAVRALGEPRIRLFDLPKSPGFGNANRNVALRQAQGRLLAFAAHDDLWLPDHLALLGHVLDTTGVALAYTRPAWVSTDGVIAPFPVNLELPDERVRFARHNVIPAPCFGTTRTALEAAGRWPEEVDRAADWALWHRILALPGAGVLHWPQPTNLHFAADWKTSRHSLMAELRDWLDIADKAAWWPRALSHPPTPGETEQATIWRVFQADPNWPLVLRAALDTAIARVAWEAIQATRPRLAEAEAELRLGGPIAALYANMTHSHAELSARLDTIESLLRPSP